MFKIFKKAPLQALMNDQRLRHFILALFTVAPFCVVAYQIFIFSKGFYLFDDWSYLQAFEYFAAGDFAALFSAVCEHRPIFAKLAFYVAYALGYSTNPIIYFGLVLKFITLLVLLVGIRPAFQRTYALTMLSAALIMISPVQGWAIARAVYVEIFVCTLGAVVFLYGCSRNKMLLIAAGFFLSLISTPGWLALIPAYVFFIILLWVHRVRQITIRDVSILVVMALTAVAYGGTITRRTTFISAAILPCLNQQYTRSTICQTFRLRTSDSLASPSCS